jgi:WD40 repeat protein
VSSVAYSPCGKWIISGSYDHTVRIWDAATGAAVGSPLRGHDGKDGCICSKRDEYGRIVVDPVCPVRGHRYVPSL